MGLTLGILSIMPVVPSFCTASPPGGRPSAVTVAPSWDSPQWGQGEGGPWGEGHVVCLRITGRRVLFRKPPRLCPPCSLADHLWGVIALSHRQGGHRNPCEWGMGTCDLRALPHFNRHSGLSPGPLGKSPFPYCH